MSEVKIYLVTRFKDQSWSLTVIVIELYVLMANFASSSANFMTSSTFDFC